MTLPARLGRKALTSFGLITLFAVSAQSFAAAADNIWESTFGQRWFYETRSYGGQVLAGTWWESSLTPGNTYRIAFTVNRIRGRMAVMVGNNPAVTINSTGDYSYDFTITEGNPRRMIFRSDSRDVLASVNGISVTQHWTSSADTQSSHDGSAHGHYLSFARERNLKIEVTNVMDAPWRVNSTFVLNRARDLDRAFTTPGVAGLWMSYDWRSVEVGDGVYDWSAIDDNMEVARRYGLKMIVKIGDRSFDGANILPRYFPSQYVLWTSGGGKSGVVSKRWDPYVYNRLIRLYQRIAARYESHPAFAGIATAETALGNFSGGDYTLGKYRNALIQVATQTQSALSNGKLFFYMNFIKGSNTPDMNKDARVAILRNVPHGNLVIGGPDITPDRAGMPGSVNSYRVHARRTMSNLQQFCHAQHVDQGLGGVNVKSNAARDKFRQLAANIRERESRPWFRGTPAALEFDDLRDPQGNRVDRHPQWVVGDPWQPEEVMSFATRNYGCDFFMWHYREEPRWNEFGWEDIRPVIMNSPDFHQ